MNLLLITQIVDRTDPNLGFFHTWIEKIADRVDHLTVVCLKKGEYDLPENVTVYSLGKEENVSRLQYMIRFYRLLFAERKKYDHVFVHMNPEYVILGGLFWRMTGKKILLWYTHKAVNLRLRIAEKLATRIFTASKESFRLPSSKVEIVGHGIDTDMFSQEIPASDGGPIRCVCVGRISPVKDIETVLLAFHKLLEKRPHDSVQLDIIGEPITEADDVYRETLVLLTKKLGLLGCVHWLGGKRYRDIADTYRTSHILIHTSKTGSVDKVVLEALAAGLTVFSSSDAYNMLEPYITTFAPNNPGELAILLEKKLSTGILGRNQKAAAFVRRQYSLDRVTLAIVDYFSI